MRLQQFFCSLLVALLACKDVMGAPPEMGNRMYEGDRIYEGNLARYLQALQQIPPPDAEYLGLIPRLSPRYNTGNDWADQREPAIYLLPEPEEREVRKRVKPSLSIVNSLDVLRRRVLLDMIRRQESEKSKQAEVNRQILQSVGKRAN